MALKNESGSTPRDLKTFLDGAAAAGKFLENQLVELDTDASSMGLSKARYYDRFDRLYWRASEVNTSGPNNPWVYTDPLFVNSSEPQSKHLGSHSTLSALHVGDWDRVLDVQYMYGRDTGITATGWARLDSNLDADAVTPDPYPNVGHTTHQGALPSSGAGSTGYYQSGTIGGWVFFEGLGYALSSGISVRTDDSTLSTTVLAQIDLTTGAAVVYDGIPIRYSSSASHESHRPPLFGRTVTFDGIQFLPDEDSTPAAPKGRLMFYEGTPAAESPPDIQPVLLKLVEFNPGGITTPGQPVRVHNREILVTQFEILESDYGAGAWGGFATDAVFLHPPSNRIYHLVAAAAAGSVPGVGKTTVDANESEVTELLTVPEVAELTSPTELARPSTGRTVEFATTALGSLSERIAGVRVDWALKRASTVDEVLDTSGAPATNTVANIPIDVSETAAAILVVKQDGTPLVLATDYTVVAATGVITWLLSHPAGGSVYTVTYQHRETPAAPAFGTLLSASATTDSEGQARTRVKYADDAALVGELDDIEVTEQ